MTLGDRVWYDTNGNGVLDSYDLIDGYDGTVERKPHQRKTSGCSSGCVKPPTNPGNARLRIALARKTCPDPVASTPGSTHTHEIEICHRRLLSRRVTSRASLDER